MPLTFRSMASLFRSACCGKRTCSCFLGGANFPESTTWSLSRVSWGCPAAAACSTLLAAQRAVGERHGCRRDPHALRSVSF